MTIQEEFEKWWKKITPVDDTITEYQFIEMAFKAGYEQGDKDGKATAWNTALSGVW